MKSESLAKVFRFVVIVGGILFSLVLTLFVIPAMYSYMSSKKKNIEELDIMAPPQPVKLKKELVEE